MTAQQRVVQPYVERPWFLMGVPTAYAVYIHDGTMEPVFKGGHLAYINPSIPPQAGDDVVIHLTNGQGFLKRLVRRTERKIVVEQFNPPRSMEWEPREVAAMHTIVASLRVRT